MDPSRQAAGIAGGDPVAGVVKRMEEIATSLPAADGVARFNDLYLAVTREVGAETRAETFEDPDFLSRLDVVFADLYFAAVDADARGVGAGRAWAPLFEARARRGIAPIQYALAGMNAHINHDLALALLEAFHDVRGGPRRGSAQHRDYLRVNAILERVEERVKARFATGLIGVADEALGRLDDVVAMWKVARARDSAWTYAETLWAIRDRREHRDALVGALGRMVGLAGRGLLARVL